MNQNPYAPPSREADGEPAPGVLTVLGGGLRREGDLIVIPVTGASFPPRCVICNESAVQRLKRRLFWHPPGYYALILTGWALYLIVSLMVRKRADFDVGLCQRHVTRRRTGLLLAWVGSIVCFGGLVASVSNLPVLASVFGLALLGCMITGVIMARVVTAKRIDKQSAWLKFERPFLDSIEY